MGDTMIGDGTCRRCRRGAQHVCDSRAEVGMRGYDGALADQIVVPASSLHALPDSVDAALGALVEPAGSALRAARAAASGVDNRALVCGPGTIGLLVAMFLQACDVRVHLLAATRPSRDFARSLGFDNTWSRDELPDVPFDAVVDASNDAGLPMFALDLVEPAGRVVYVGLAGAPSLIDSRQLALKDVTAIGILSASPALEETIDAFASGVVDPRPIVAATVPLERVGDVLSGWRPDDAGPGPKIHIDPRLSV
jgi:threonine dehydrogenase-like Zn-dependent dehydrogenase